MSVQKYWMMRINSKFLLLKYYIFIYKIIMDINNRIKKKVFYVSYTINKYNLLNESYNTQYQSRTF